MKLPLVSFHLKNFKAVRDSGTVKFTPLTALIGNNGSGKSSLIEGLQTYQSILTEGLDNALAQWRGFEHIRNAAIPHKARESVDGRAYETNPIEFKVNYHIKTPTFQSKTKDELQSHSLSVTASPNGDEVFILEESLVISRKKNLSRSKDGVALKGDGNPIGIDAQRLMGGESIITNLRNDFVGYREVYNFIQSWQFVLLNPASMGNPRTQKRSGGSIRLESDGSNIAEFLLDIRRQNPDALEGIIETLQHVLPYARDVQPTLASELERAVYLQLSEENFKIPGWLLSTGTLRVLALLALLRHPNPPPLIIIEELENGLDPRTVHLIIQEMINVVQNLKSQIILTTHSPYLLNLLTLSQIVIVERSQGGEPIFSRPSDRPELERWTDNFAPGDLYTAGRLNTVVEK